MADIDGNLLVSSNPVTIPETDMTEWRTATLTVEDADIRYRVTGKDPVGGNGGGHLVVDGSQITITGYHNIKKLSLIRDASTDAQVFYTLEK